MSEMFESFNALSRGSDERVLEHYSLRSLFLWLLVSVFLLGAGLGIAMLRAFHLHSFDWSDLFPYAALSVIVVRFARILYRRLSS